jgi:hypothetical protein
MVLKGENEGAKPQFGAIAALETQLVTGPDLTMMEGETG